MRVGHLLTARLALRYRHNFSCPPKPSFESCQQISSFTSRLGRESTVFGGRLKKHLVANTSLLHCFMGKSKA